MPRKPNDIIKREIKVRLELEKCDLIDNLVKAKAYPDRTKFSLEAIEEKLNRELDKMRKRLTGKKQTGVIVLLDKK